MGHYKAQDFITAIKGSGGNVTLVANRVGCARKTVYDWLDKYPTVKQAFDDERESMKDHAESLLFKKMTGFIQKVGEKKIYVAPDTTAIIFYLKTIGRDRGYIEKIDLNISSDVQAILPNLLKEIENAGLEAIEVFNSMLAELASVQSEDD